MCRRRQIRSANADGALEQSPTAVCVFVGVHVCATRTCESVAVTLDYWGQSSVQPTGVAGNQTKLNSKLV